MQKNLCPDDCLLFPNDVSPWIGHDTIFFDNSEPVSDFKFKNPRVSRQGQEPYLSSLQVSIEEGLLELYFENYLTDRVGPTQLLSFKQKRIFYFIQ